MKKSTSKILGGIFLLFLIFSLLFKKVTAYQYFLVNPEVILSTSSPEATDVEYKFRFLTQFSLEGGERIEIFFPEVYSSPITSPEKVRCPPNFFPSVNGRMVSCTVMENKSHPPTTTQIIVEGVTNPKKEAPFGIADVYFLSIETSKGEGALLPVAIVETLRIGGKVHPFLSFEIRGLDKGERIHENLVTTVSTTPSSIAFQDIPFNIPILGAQDIFVTTNAGFGFRLNLIQNDDLKSVGNDGRVHRIFCFENGRCKSLENATFWIKPEGILGDPKTYGHFGITSEDNSLGEGCLFNYYNFGQNPKWVGLEPGKPVEIMRHCGPSDGKTRHQGWTRIGFQVEITPLQPAGNYQTTFTYVLTPIF